jgi:predicted enzyme related to lactoylglutathione lyase
MMARALDAGAEVLMPVSDMGEMVGSIGFFKDSEGNRIGVHQASTP